MQGDRDTQAQLRLLTLRRKHPALLILVQISPSYLSCLFLPHFDNSASTAGTPPWGAPALELELQALVSMCSASYT